MLSAGAHTGVWLQACCWLPNVEVTDLYPTDSPNRAEPPVPRAVRSSRWKRSVHQPEERAESKAGVEQCGALHLLVAEAVA